MDIGVIGVNHKLADLRQRELLARACDKRWGSGSDEPVVLLLTCNRTEIYFSASDLAQRHIDLLATLREEVAEEFDQKLYSYFGRDCFLHLAQVTAGLDSKIVGETEIQGQVKRAYEEAKRPLPADFHFLFQKSLKVGKQVRATLPVAANMATIEGVIGDQIRTACGKARVLVVGASMINDPIVRRLKTRGCDVALANRTLERAEMWADRWGIALHPWGELSDWHTYDAVILGTKASEPLIECDHLPPLVTTTQIFDLGVPRNADPALADHPAVTLFDIDQINSQVEAGREFRQEALETAHALVDAQVSGHLTRFHAKSRLALAAG